jgi:hypothetical protein
VFSSVHAASLQGPTVDCKRTGCRGAIYFGTFWPTNELGLRSRGQPVALPFVRVGPFSQRHFSPHSQLAKKPSPPLPCPSSIHGSFINPPCPTSCSMLMLPVPFLPPPRLPPWSLLVAVGAGRPSCLVSQAKEVVDAGAEGHRVAVKKRPAEAALAQQGVTALEHIVCVQFTQNLMPWC